MAQVARGPASRAVRHGAEKARVTLVGGLVNLALGGVKIAAGVVGQSQALIVDGVHSLSDLASDGLVLLASRLGSREADLDHPYGHARIETAATAGVGAVLLLVAGGFTYDAVARLVEPERLLEPGWLALAAALASLVIKEGLYHYTQEVARRSRSPLISANAWHHRSDALSSLVVVGGIAGVMAGLAWLDAVAAILVALMLARIGWGFAWDSVRELVDTGLDPQELERLAGLIDEVDGVRSHHGLRTRRMGPDVLADVHIVVGPRVSVSEGHRVAEAVRRRLVAEVEPLNEVLVHIDYEPEVFNAANNRLPLRSEVEAMLFEAWAEIPEARHVERIGLHYLAGRLQVEVFIPLEPLPDLAGAERLAERLRAAAERLEPVERVDVYFG